MESKEIVQMGYDCFAKKDLETFATLYHENCKIHVNGMHRFSRTYNGIGDWIQNHLAFIPTLFDEFTVEPIEMTGEGNRVFVRSIVKAAGMEFEAGHLFTLEGGKICEFCIYDDSQKVAHAMKAI